MRASARRDASGRFLNPDGSNGGKTLGDIWRLQKHEGVGWPAVVAPPQVTSLPAVPPGHAGLTHIGHATTLIQIAGGPTLLIDPIWSERCSPVGWFGPKRVRPAALDFDALPPLDAILVTHNHYDHCDLPTLRRLAARARVPVITGLGNAGLIAPTGLAPVTELDWWGEHVLADGTRLTYTPTQHGSARGPFDRCRALWGGFCIEAHGGRILATGDTAWGPHLAEIGAELGPFDAALIPIGAYDPEWFMGSVHITPEQAVVAHHALRARVSLAMHWGVFRLSGEAINEPPARLREARGEADFRVPDFGETMMVRLG
ncbi:MBL fold metallo-hydrolase [Plastoroseomonas arctica]|uniref:MBL fold metallo-hydrolase n=1 Tax=Plastoroseomonas arctica TaxID=1509237 RepID=UPI00346351C3